MPTKTSKQPYIRPYKPAKDIEEANAQIRELYAVINELHRIIHRRIMVRSAHTSPSYGIFIDENDELYQYQP